MINRDYNQIDLESVPDYEGMKILKVLQAVIADDDEGYLCLLENGREFTEAVVPASHFETI